MFMAVLGLKEKKKLCAKLKSYPQWNVDIDIEFDIKLTEVLVLISNFKLAGWL